MLIFCTHTSLQKAFRSPAMGGFCASSGHKTSSLNLINLFMRHALEKKLARYAQLYSRIGFAHEYRPIGKEEMFFILEHHWKKLGLELKRDSFADTETIAAVVRATNGNFRLIHRLFSQIQRIMKINELRSITAEVVEAARSCLVIGNI